MKKYFAALALLLSVTTAQAAIMEGDFRTESNLPDYRHGIALIYEHQGAFVGSGAELTSANLSSNADHWVGGQVDMDLDPDTNRLILKSNDLLDFQTFDAYIDNVLFSGSQHITGISTISDALIAPLYTPTLSFTDDSIHISFSAGHDEFYFTNGAAEFQLEVGDLQKNGFQKFGFAALQAPAAAPVPEPSTLVLLGLGLAGCGIFGRRFRKP